MLRSKLPFLWLFVPLVHAQTWCGKVYMKNETVVPPTGQFTQPTTSLTPLLALRCTPSLRPYLPEDSSLQTSIILDALLRYEAITGAEDITLDGNDGQGQVLDVTASLGGTEFAKGTVGLNGTTDLTFSISDLSIEPSLEAYNITCTASTADGSQTFSAQTQLYYLPEPDSSIGSVTKMDLRTGGLLAKPFGEGASTGGDANGYQALFPVGYYTSFDWLVGNVSVLETLKEQGFNIIHPIPDTDPFSDNADGFNAVLDKMEELGLYLMYDMRNTFQNHTSVTSQLSKISSRRSLLLYYTADEPDGTSVPLTGSSSPSSTSTLIRSIDPYRPISLVLNCADYYFEGYVDGVDVVMQDAYSVGNNVSWSVTWDTVCNEEQGCCGCDNCVGGFEDVRNRVEVFGQRFEALGMERTKSVWTVPQAFGEAEYWPRNPTGLEWLVQAIVAINAGALGVVSWSDPTTDDIKAASSAFALALPAITPYILPFPSSSENGTMSSYQHVVTDERVDIGIWTLDKTSSSNSSTTSKLIIATNLNYNTTSIPLSSLNLSLSGTVAPTLVMTYNDSATLDEEGGNLVFESVGSGVWIFNGQEDGTVQGSQSSGAVRTIGGGGGPGAWWRVEF